MNTRPDLLQAEYDAACERIGDLCADVEKAEAERDRLAATLEIYKASDIKFQDLVVSLDTKCDRMVARMGELEGALQETNEAITEAVEAENKACEEIARADMKYYAGLNKISKGNKWGEAEDAAEVIAMNIKNREKKKQ